MVSKTKTKARKKGKPTKGSKKSKSTIRKKSGVNKIKQRKTSPAVARTRKASQKPKKTTTTISNTIGPSTKETKLLKEQSTEDTMPQIQEESVPEVSQVRGDEEISSPSTANTDEDVGYENNTITETT